MFKTIKKNSSDKIVNGWYMFTFASGVVQFIYVQDNSDHECDYTIYYIDHSELLEVDGGVISEDFDNINLWFLEEFIYGELFEESDNSLSSISVSLMLDNNGEVISDLEEGCELIEKGA